MDKQTQLYKTKRVNLKKLSRLENKLFHDSILDSTGGICQLCNEAEGADFHHTLWGCYGANKDDSRQILVCRKCHELCHKEKHGVVNTIAIKISELNWKEYNV